RRAQSPERRRDDLRCGDGYFAPDITLLRIAVFPVGWPRKGLMKLKKRTARRPQKRARGRLVKSTKRVSGNRVLSRKTPMSKVKVKKAGDEHMISKAKTKTTRATRRVTHAVAHEASAPAH